MGFLSFLGQSKNAGEDAKNRDLTTKQIAVALLYTFVVSVALLFAINAWIASQEGGIAMEKDGEKNWFDLLKNALILLGTALTTIIGYYFGQREGALKEADAAKKLEEADKETMTIVEQATQARVAEIRQRAAAANDAPEANAPSSSEGAGDIVIPS